MSKLESYLTRKAGVLAQRRTDFTSDPTAAVVQVKASSKVAGITGARPTRMGETVWVTDAAPGLAGHALGPSAPEMLLGALASCLVHTYLIQAALLGIPLDHVEVEASGSLDLTGVVGLAYHEPPRMAQICYSAAVESSADADTIQKLHDLVEQTCPVLNTVRYPVEVKRE